MKLKICGVQNPAEIHELIARKVSYAGLNFVHSSKRQISKDTAGQIAQVAGKSIELVALFQDAHISEVADTAKQLDIKYIQLHGNESATYIKTLTELGYKVIKSVPIGVHTKLEEAESYIAERPAELYLLDREQQGQGESVNHKLASQLATNHKVFLAGGLNPSNLQQTLQNVGVKDLYGIDIASGVRDGVKLNLDKLDQILRILEVAQ